MMEFLLLLGVIIALVCAALGFKGGYNMGHDAGWDAGHAFACDKSEVEFRKAVSMCRASAAITEEREALAELHVHPILLPPADLRERSVREQKIFFPNPGIRQMDLDWTALVPVTEWHDEPCDSQPSTDLPHA
jgi:hypothetical protein